MNVSVPNEAVTAGPHVQWNHIDGPLMTWAGHLYWLTWGERIRIALWLTTVDKIASERWPYTAMRRRELLTEKHGARALHDPQTW